MLSATSNSGCVTRGIAAEDGRKAWACATLGVNWGAARTEIERAYRDKMKRAHPDQGGSVARATALNRARDLLAPQR